MNDSELDHRVTEILGFEICEMFDKPLYEWAIAGALMERVLDEGFVFDIGQKVRIVSTDIAIPINDSFPRAIVEACVEALKVIDDE